ncbi:MAG: hypothetical protein PHI35_06270 [Victivallaceae bacterium]|nr:hypothetical protein [Victivallaceae bacterium]
MHFSELTNMDFWRTLLCNDFNRGYVAALMLVLTLIVVLMVLRLILHLIFRNKRCSEFTVKAEGGDVVISQDAIENATRQVLDEYSSLSVNRIRLFRRGGKYTMSLYCSFCDDGNGLPEVLKNLKPAIVGTLKKTFGVENLAAIKFSVESFSAATPITIREPEKSSSDAPLSL